MFEIKEASLEFYFRNMLSISIGVYSWKLTQKELKSILKSMKNKFKSLLEKTQIVWNHNFDGGFKGKIMQINKNNVLEITCTSF